MADVTAIQRGYLKDPVQFPGFSLDPPKSGRGDVVETLRQGRMYHRARYEGGLKGTEVGMTLFYSDLIAKMWVSGTGTGVPTKAVKGFVPDPDAVIPLGHCPAAGKTPEERGRLWFGQNQSGFLFDDKRMEIGARATRLFMRTSAADGGEVESSYGFGRGLRWWDAHFQEIADYDPQFARLDQIMRWSAALEWLSTRSDSPRLPGLDDRDVRDDLRFKEWYQRHSELRERGDLTFVPGARETVITGLSKAHEYCGQMIVKGGVSLADTVHHMDEGTWRPGAVPEADRRAGLYDPSSRLDSDGKGKISQVWLDGEGQVVEHLDRQYSTAENGVSVIETTGKRRPSGSFGKLKVWRGKSAKRSLRIERGAKDGFITESVALEGREWGRLEADATGGRVLLRWVRGLLERARLALQSTQDGSAPARGSVLYRYGDSYKVGGHDAPWLSITKDIKAPADDLAFRLGRPRPGGAPEFLLGRLSPRPGEGPSSPRGPPPGSWLEFRGGSSAVIGLPSDRARTMRVETTDGQRSEARVLGDIVWAKAHDPLMGLNSPEPPAALLREFGRVAPVWRDAQQARDGRFRGVSLGEDGTALVGADKTIIAPPGHHFAERVREALGPDLARSRPLIALESGHAVHHGQGEIIPGKQRETMELSEVAGRENVFVSDWMRSVTFRDGALISGWERQDRKVVVKKAELKIDARIESPTVLADSQQQRTSSNQTLTWLRVTGPGGRPSGGYLPTPIPNVQSTSPSPTPSLPPSPPLSPRPNPPSNPPSSPSPPPSPTPPAPRGDVVTVPIWLVCLDESPQDPACAP
ncbi:hypothetical protein E1298_07950 [Actinomadura rubrisoli]|uniref:Uncharacterized protein n=2 Tax=Actinomadura rubrisoli TaxID=2530368 RepID=A0A4R5CA83_9ACTN|nr:hypothetical protein E1298_07950 [Actinomadura rubrisoli]